MSRNEETTWVASIVCLVAMVCVWKLSNPFQLIAFGIQLAAFAVGIAAGYRWTHERDDHDEPVA